MAVIKSDQSQPLRLYCEIFNDCDIVKCLFFDRYGVGPVPELPETPTHLSLLSDSVMRTPALNELSDEEKAGVCASLCVQAPFYSCTANRGSVWSEEMPKNTIYSKRKQIHCNFKQNCVN